MAGVQTLVILRCVYVWGDGATEGAIGEVGHTSLPG